MIALHGAYQGLSQIADDSFSQQGSLWLQDAAAALLGAQVQTDFLLLLTDAPAVYDPRSWPSKKEPVPSPITPDALRRLGSFAAGSMGPKVKSPVVPSHVSTLQMPTTCAHIAMFDAVRSLSNRSRLHELEGEFLL